MSPLSISKCWPWLVPVWTGMYCHTMGPQGLYHWLLVIDLLDDVIYWYNVVHTFARLVYTIRVSVLYWYVVLV